MTRSAPIDGFTSRWGLIVASLGMAIGTGNIWRFPRIVAQNGGGSFLVPWLIFLFSWSIPLIILEFSLGKAARRGTIGSFGRLNGRNWLWMGVFVGACALLIFCYYAVVTGWCFRYTLVAVGDLFGITSAMDSLSGQDGAVRAEEAFVGFTHGLGPLLFHGIAVAAACLVVGRGVARGVERASKILVPTLFGILLLAAVRSLTLPGASAGLQYLFEVDLSLLMSHEIWIQALTQSAWSTGAGWGLVLTYASYMRRREDVVLNSVLTGLGNNSASLLVGFVVFPAVFALAPATMDPVKDILQNSGPASTGISFIWIPVLFADMPLGSVFNVLFFLALSVAALSSLIAMVQLGVRVLQDAGVGRRAATLGVAALGIVVGVPSALSTDFFSNQDWVWSVGLLFCGLFLAIAAIRFGVERFRTHLVNSEGNDLSLGKWFSSFTLIVIPLQGILLVCWWTVGSILDDLEAGVPWWNPFRTYGLATCIAQFALLVGLCLVFRRPLIRWFLGDERSLREELADSESTGGPLTEGERE